MIKRVSLFAVVMVAAVVMAACGGNGETAEERAQREALEQAAEFFSDLGIDVAAPVVPGITAAEEDAPEPATEPATDINLGLPIVVTEITFSSATAGIAAMITADGTLIWAPGSFGEIIIDTDVRSFVSTRNGGDMTTLYIKNDNSLWGIGNNGHGRLGDGSGVNRETPVHIMDNVAMVHIQGRISFALQTDGTLYTWGGGRFSPVQLAENIASVIHFDPLIVHSRAGYAYRIIHHAFGNPLEEIELIRISYIAGHDMVVSPTTVAGRESISLYIDTDHNLVRRNYHITIQANTFEGEDVLASNAERIFTDGGNMFLLTQDGGLWGMGQNANGELGDGTRVPRDEPVWIADGVIYAGSHFFIRQNGEFWAWDSADPTPQQQLDGVAIVTEGAYIHLNDGRVIANRGTRNEAEIENVRIPQVRTFN